MLKFMSVWGESRYFNQAPALKKSAFEHMASKIIFFYYVYVEGV